MKTALIEKIKEVLDDVEFDIKNDKHYYKQSYAESILSLLESQEKEASEIISDTHIIIPHNNEVRKTFTTPQEKIGFDSGFREGWKAKTVSIQPAIEVKPDYYMHIHTRRVLSTDDYAKISESKKEFYEAGYSKPQSTHPTSEIDFYSAKEFLSKELNLIDWQKETMLDDYVKACIKYAQLSQPTQPVKSAEEISEMASEYALKCDPLSQTLEKQADIRQGFIAGAKAMNKFRNQATQAENQGGENQGFCPCKETCLGCFHKDSKCKHLPNY